MSYTVTYVLDDGSSGSYSDISSLFFNLETIEVYRDMKFFASLPVQFLVSIDIKIHHD